MADEELRTFVAVARCGSLTQAAKELFVSQPAVTRQIHKLEARYQISLFRRHERGVELTPAGRMLAAYAARIIDLEDEAAEELAALSQSNGGSLRVGATLTIGEYVLPPIIGRFRQAQPQTELLLEVENTTKVVEHVVSGQYDCGLVEGPVHHHLVRTERLSDDELVVVLAAEHRLATRAELTLAELVAEPLLLREPGSGTRSVFEEALQRAGVDPKTLRVAMQLGSTQAIKGLVAQRLGLAVLSAWTVREELRSGALRQVMVPALDLHRAFSFVFARDGRLSRLTRAFVRFCRQQLGSEEGTSPDPEPVRPMG